MLCYHGSGFTFSEVYNMPVYLRMWYLQKLADTRKEENDAQHKAMNKTKGTQIARPTFEKPT